MKDCIFTLTIDGRSVAYTYDGLRGYLLDMANLSTLAPDFAAKNAKKLNITGAVERPAPTALAPEATARAKQPTARATKKQPTPPAIEGERVTESSLSRVFNLTKTQAKAVLTLWKAMGIPLDKIRLRRGAATPAGERLEQRIVTPQMDAEYMAAVKAGDTAKAQEIINKAAKDAGYTIGPVYHGTKRKFWVFNAAKGRVNAVRDAVRTPAFFSFNKEFAEDYANYGRPEGDRKPTRLITAFIKAESLWDYRKKADAQKAAQAGFAAEQLKTGDWRAIESPKFQKWLRDNGYNGFVNRERFADNIAVFDSSQVKSADPITYDNKGNIIPPSQRFQPTKPDIRYQEATRASDESFIEEFRKTKLISAKLAKRMLTDQAPEYLKEVGEFIFRQRKKFLEGRMTVRDIAKAYIITLSSINARAIQVSTLEANTGFKVPAYATSIIKGKLQVRPEDAVSAWLLTPEGKRALDSLEKGGRVDLSLWEPLFKIRDSYGANSLRNWAFNSNSPKLTLYRAQEMTDAINSTKGDLKQLDAAVQATLGIAEAKTGFIKHLLGFGETPTIDAREINYWLTGQANVAQLKSRQADLVRQAKTAKGLARQVVVDRISAKIARLAKDYNFDPAIGAHVMHHWIWDATEGESTTHAVMMEAMELAQEAYHATRQNFAPEEGFPNGRFRLDKVSTQAEAGRYGWGIYFASTQQAASVQAEEAAEGKAVPIVYELDIPNEIINRLNGYDKPLSSEQRRKLIVEARKAGLNMETLAQADVWQTDTPLSDIMVELENEFEQLDAQQGGSLASLQQATSELLARVGVLGVTVQLQDGPQYVIWDQQALNRISVAPANKQEIANLREKVQETAFPAERQPTVNGYIEFLTENQQALAEGVLAVIQGFESANLSTPIHEGFHFFRRFMLHEGNGFEKQDIDEFEKWAGVTNGEWTVAAEEKAARAFEKYIRDGLAPVYKLQKLFDQLRDWMIEIYQAITGTALDVDIPPRVRDVFDKMVDRRQKEVSLKDNGALIQGLKQVSQMRPSEFGRFRRAIDGLAGIMKQLGGKAVSALNSNERNRLEQRVAAVESAAGITGKAPTRLYQEESNLEDRVSVAEALGEAAPTQEQAAQSLEDFKRRREDFLKKKITAEEFARRVAQRRAPKPQAKGEIKPAQPRKEVTEKPEVKSKAKPPKERKEAAEKPQERKAAVKLPFFGKTIAEYTADLVEQATQKTLEPSRPLPSEAKLAERAIAPGLRAAAKAFAEGRIEQADLDNLVNQASNLYETFKDVGLESEAFTRNLQSWRKAIARIAPPRQWQQKRPGFGGKTVDQVLADLVDRAEMGRLQAFDKAQLTESEKLEQRIASGLRKAVVAALVTKSDSLEVITNVLESARDWIDAVASPDPDAAFIAESRFQDIVNKIHTGKSKPARDRQTVREMISTVRRQTIRKEMGITTGNAKLTEEEAEQRKTDSKIKAWIKQFEQVMQEVDSDGQPRMSKRMDSAILGAVDVDRRELFYKGLEDYRAARDAGESHIAAQRVVEEALRVPSRLDNPYTVKQGLSGSAMRAGSFRTPLSTLNIPGSYERIAGPLGRQASDIFHLVHARYARQKYSGLVDALNDLRTQLGMEKRSASGWAIRRHSEEKPSLLGQLQDAGYGGLAETIVAHVQRIEDHYKTMVRVSKKFEIALKDGTRYTATGEARPKQFPSQGAAEAYIRQMQGNQVQMFEGAQPAKSTDPSAAAFQRWVKDPGLLAATVIKSYVYNSKLRYSPKGMLMNYISLLMTIWPHVTTRQFGKIFNMAWNDPDQVRDVALREAGGYYETTGYQLASEAFAGAIAPLPPPGIRGWLQRVKHVLTDPFARSNEFARIAGHYTGKLLWAEMERTRGKLAAPADPTEITEQDLYVQQWTSRTEFDNSQWNIQPIFSGPLGSTLGQFRPFQLKNFERLLADYSRRPVQGSPVGYMARVAKLTAAYMLFGGFNVGLSAVPFVGGLGGPLMFAVLAMALREVGADDEWADKAAIAMMYGLPATIGIDLSGSLLFLDELYGNNPAEVIVGLLGPGVGTGVQLTEDVNRLISLYNKPAPLGRPGAKAVELEKQWFKIAQTILPYPAKVTQTARDIARGIPSTMRLGEKEQELTGYEQAIRALGGTPMRQTLYYDQEAKGMGRNIRDIMLGRPLERAGMPRRPGESYGEYAKRKVLVEQWENKYGQQLRSSSRFKRLTPEQQEAAGNLLQSRIINQAEKPARKRTLRDLDAFKIIREIQQREAKVQRPGAE